MTTDHSAATLHALLQRVAQGELAPAAALSAIESAQQAPIEALSDAEGTVFARLDHERAARQGFPEVIFCAGKTPSQTASIAARLHGSGATLLATRATPEHFAAVRAAVAGARWHETARVIEAEGATSPTLKGTVGVLCAGTSDLPVAEEAAVCGRVMGARIEKFYDCGVAGLHRLLAVLPQVRACDVLICAAGMEGALVSVVAGLVDVPVVALPTSVGYGASFGGVSALLTMLNSCANGVAVVNIDNGFSAAAFAASILRTSTRL